MSFGTDLKQQRVARNVELEEISSATRVSLRHLQCLEADDFNSLPGGVFKRGIVRNYARFLEIDEQETLDAFENACRSKGIAANPEAEWTEFAVNVSRQRGRRERSPLVQWLGVAGMLIVVLAAGVAVWWFLLRHHA